MTRPRVTLIYGPNPLQVRHLNESMLYQSAIPHPGIGPVYPDDEITHHAYYQWVPFVLFAQAICFYLPHLFWRSWENGKIKTLVVGLQTILLSKFIQGEEDLKINASYVIYSKPTLTKKASLCNAILNFLLLNFCIRSCRRLKWLSFGTSR
jgi:hypothetical protein